jgi:hypothetical protein
MEKLTLKQKQWLWFIFLWFVGLAAVSLIGLFVKILFLI